MSDNISVRMDVDNLNTIPSAPLPTGYQFRMYKMDDIDVWVNIYKSADIYNTITPELFRREFGFDENIIGKRMIFLIDTTSGEAVGTSTAWSDPGGNPKEGRVHWVAILPGYQGKGLAKPLLAETLRILRDNGCVKAFLMTSTGRIPAITLYLKFGFLPVIQSEEQHKGWSSIRDAVRPEFRAAVAHAIAGS